VNARRFFILVGAGLLLFPLLGASCGTYQAPSGSGLPVLQFDGDSITVKSTADLNAHYAAAYDVGITATSGWDTFLDGPTSADITKEVAEAPAIEVINLGTNDLFRLGVGDAGLGEPAQSLDQVEANLAGDVAAFPSSTCVIVTTINSHDENPTWDPTGAAQTFDDWIRATFPHVADWDAAYQDSYFTTLGQPHPNEVGNQALIATYDQAIATCPTTSTTVTTATSVPPG
jgi:hypothetical protein